jgi:dolichyl-phosphate beta-glucosyltransferase
MMKVSIVIPAFNEARRLPSTLVAIDAFLASSSSWLPAEVIVVDDGSRDDTKLCTSARPELDGVTHRTLRHRVNRGKGAAVRTGLADSLGEQVLVFDADNATPIEELGRLDGFAKTSIVIGSRAVDRSLIANKQPWWRDRLGRGFNLIVRSLVGLQWKDTQCGFKLLPAAFAREAAGVTRIDGFAFDVELLVLARHWGIAIEEVAVRWHHVEESRVHPIRHAAQMLRDVILLRCRALAGRLPDSHLNNRSS